MYRVLLCCLACFISSCGYDSFDDNIDHQSTDLVNNMDVAEVRILCKDGPISVTDDVVISGYVTATDRADNFYRTFVVQDVDAAIEVRAGLRDLHNIYRQDQQIYILLKGLMVGLSTDGVLQVGIGRMLWGEMGVDYFGYRSILDSHVVRSMQFNKIEPKSMTIKQLNPLMAGTLVRLDALRLDTGEPPCWTSPDQAAFTSTHYRSFSDRDGHKIIVATSGYANFAAHVIPNGEVSLVGILLYSSAKSVKPVYMLKLRHEEDILL